MYTQYCSIWFTQKVSDVEQININKHFQGPIKWNSFPKLKMERIKLPMHKTIQLHQHNIQVAGLLYIKSEGGMFGSIWYSVTIGNNFHFHLYFILGCYLFFLAQIMGLWRNSRSFRGFQSQNLSTLEVKHDKKIITCNSSMNDIDAAVRNAGFLCQLHDKHGCTRVSLRWFKNHGVAANQCHGEHLERKCTKYHQTGLVGELING